MLKALLEEKKAVRTAVAVQGKHMGVQIMWGSQVYDNGGEEALCLRWRQALAETKGETCVMVGEDLVYVQTYAAQPELVILGGGHISKSLVPLGKLLGYQVTLADDRPEFADEGRKAGADRIVCGEYEEIFERLPEGPSVSYVVVTRGHMGDEICVRQILQRQFQYAGMIGSKKKVAVTRERLRQEGISEELIARLHAPIGIPIGAVTPQEIAVSIAAELILVKNRKASVVIEKKILESLTGDGEKILLTIVEKHGSAPQRAGACMVVGTNGVEAGTIGGGAIEYQAGIHAAHMLSEGRKTDFRTYELSNDKSADLGMICGGRCSVFFQAV